MLKLRRYYKPFLGAILLVICLLVIQASCDLKLPDYMSEIVNVGIQAGGVERITPDTISEEGLEFITLFMSKEENEFFLNNYKKLETEKIYLLNDIDKQALEKMDDIFSRACKTTVNILTMYRNLNSSGDGTKISITDEMSKMNMSNLYKMIPVMKNLSEEVINEARNESLNSDDLSLSAIGKVFTKAFYNEVGIDTSKMQSNYIIKTGFKMIGISIISGICTIIVGFTTARTGASIARKLRSDVFERVQSFSSTELNKFSIASLITRTTNDITQIQQVTAMGMRMALFSPIMGIGALLMMLRKGSEMAWTLGIGLAGVIVLVIIMFIFAMPKFKIIQMLADKLNLVSKENLAGIMVIRAFGTQEHEAARFDDVNTETTKINQFIYRLMGFMMPCMTLIMNLLSVLIIWVGADMISKSVIQVGDMMAFIQYAMHVLMSFMMFTMISIMIPRAGVSANRIAEVLETEVTIKNPKNPIQFKSDKIGYVEFKNVSFSYEGANEKVLDNISFTAKPGETTAFIGSTGSGKSTLINLIPRFYDVTEGEVFVNGANVKDVDLYELHKQVGYIPQKGNLLSGSIEFNIKYGNKDAENEFMEKCAKVAQAFEFINQKEEKYRS